MHRSGRTARAAAHGLSIALVEPSDHKAYRRLCVELGTPDGLPELPIDAQMLPRVREALSIARQLDKAAHAEQRRSASALFRQKLAREMDLPSDLDEQDDDGDDDEVARRRKRKVAQEKQRLAAQLKRCLSRLERPQPGAPVHEVARAVAASSAASVL